MCSLHAFRRTRSEQKFKPLVSETDDHGQVYRVTAHGAILSPYLAVTCCSPIFSVRLVRLTDRHILLAGTELECTTVEGSNVMHERAQFWSLRPVGDSSTPG